MLVLYKQALISLGVPEAEKLVKEMAEIIETGKVCYDQYAAGCYKEVFDLRNGFVLKFCSEHNQTEEEMNILYAAENESVSDIFLPTRVVPIIGNNIVIYTEDYSMEEYYEESGEYINYASHIMIQPKIYGAVHAVDVYNIVPYSKEQYMVDPVKYSDGTIVPHRMASRFSTSKIWVQKVIHYYGDKFFDDLYDFVEEHHIYDLHGGNIGYIEDESGKLRPCILDWLS